jgi:hypothetical protein
MIRIAITQAAFDAIKRRGLDGPEKGAAAGKSRNRRQGDLPRGGVKPPSKPLLIEAAAKIKLDQRL